MGYQRQLFEDNKTILTAAHLRHIEEGIVTLEEALENVTGLPIQSNLIDIASPVSAAACWSYDADTEVWTATNSNYANLRYDIELKAGQTIVFKIEALTLSGVFITTFRTSANTTLKTFSISSGLNEFSCMADADDIYSFRTTGQGSADCGTFTNIFAYIEEVEEEVSNSGGIANEYIVEATEVGAECLDDVDADLRILLFSDNHDLTTLTKYQKYSKIMEQGVFDYSIGLGDYVDYSHATKPVARARLLNCINLAGRNSNQFYALGNHDVGICGVNAGTDSPDVMMSPKENFDIFCRHLKKDSGVVFNPEDPYGCYYYVDDEASKIRLIILNTCDIFNRNPKSYQEGLSFEEYQKTAPFIRYQQQLKISQLQLDWLANKALNFMDKETPTDWSVVLFGHWYNSFGSSNSNNLVHYLLQAVDTGTAVNKTVTISNRLTMTEEGVYSKEVDSSISDTYSINADYSEQGAVNVIGFIFGHDHVDTSMYNDGIRYVEVRCDTNALDDFYITPWTEDIAKGTYHFYSASGKLHTFTRTSSTPITDIGYIGYNDYWFRSGGTWPITIYDKEGLRKSSIGGVTTVTEVPENSTEITGFIRERGDSLVEAESCEILCINKKNKTLTFVPYGTATKRTLEY